MKRLYGISIALCILLCGFVINITGCNGKDGPVFPQLYVGEILGPARVPENCLTVYSIDVGGDPSVTCEWAVNPSAAGYFANATPTRATFCPAPVSSDTQVEIQVSVRSQYHDAETRKLSVSICDVPETVNPQLTVSEILGPPTVSGGTWATYGVEVTGDTGIAYKWSVEPSDAGTMTNPESRYTNFATFDVSSDKPAQIKVEVKSDNCGPIAKTMDVIVIPRSAQPPSLSVSSVTGPSTVDENTSTAFSVMADGDTGIKYLWSINPPGFGQLDSPSSPSVTYTAPTVNMTTSMEIQVSVSSDNCQPVIKSRQVSVFNANADVGWVKAPTELMENTDYEFAINVDPYPGPIVDAYAHLDWQCDPPYAGTFIVKMEDDNTEQYVTSVACPDVVFKAAEVQQDTSVTISVFYVMEDNFQQDIQWIFIDSKHVTVLNNPNKPDDDHWADVEHIAGPTEVIETIEYRFYYSVPDGNKNWDYEWSCKVIDDWPNGMGYFGVQPPPDPPGVFVPTRDQDGKWDHQTVEFVAYELEAKIETWVELKVKCQGGTYTFPLCIRPVPGVCWNFWAIADPRFYSYYDEQGPFPPEEPEDPTPKNSIFGQYPYQIHKGDIVRLLVLFNSYIPEDYLDCTWKTFPESAGNSATVHFWGDSPYELPQEHLWNDDVKNKWCVQLPDGSFDPLCGSHYITFGGGKKLLTWVELTCHTDKEFYVQFTVKSATCGSAVRMIRFNKGK